MIRWLRGSIHQINPSSVIVNVSGVGLEVQCTPATALSVRIGEAAEFLTSFVVREDGWTLYGFLEADEREVFDVVQTVSGIGPRIALTLLATLTPDEIRRAIGSEDVTTLTKVPGIGRKGAQRMVLELKDRIGVASAWSESVSMEAKGWQGAVKAGLISLGWSPAVADEAIDALPDPGTTPDIGALLKSALVQLDRR
jgi:holliday junction DNA helicase RuvA